ncbi:helix-turn-helix domain-containing protein [Laribacter hongkongensis]|jgi:transcriptional regulator with XRE-family HTH domain|uniref:Helix-turn-helix domain-containing protein n=1 Tax=Laribacter hongkongensis TaxID=168471 RepID=A0ABD4SLQ0_9NEIS|nr:helix-turn-helix transcriptional regulator [Laribacter hongkongensis]MCG9024504.1 helix-turn-helix domain-containing protein [Laribacter hongkongensis]
MQSPDHYADLVKFGQRLRELRTAKGFSQETLALLSGLDRSYVGGVERGQRNVSLVNILKLATALNIEPRELFS